MASTKGPQIHEQLVSQALQSLERSDESEALRLLRRAVARIGRAELIKQTHPDKNDHAQSHRAFQLARQVTKNTTPSVAENEKLEKELERAKQKLATQAGSELADQAVDVGGINVLASRVDGDSKGLRETVDQLKNKLGRAVVVLASVTDDHKVQLVAGVTQDLTG